MAFPPKLIYYLRMIGRHMIAHINGKTETVIQEVSVEKLLSMKNIDPACVVVEVNKNIVKREKYGSVILNDGDTVEILKFVGGG